MIILQILLSLILVTGALGATPTISNVSGTVSTGQILTISGANMLQLDNTNWRPLFKTSAYSFEGSSPSSDGYLGGGGTYDADVKILGSKSVRFHVQGASSNCPTDNLGDYLYTNEAGQSSYWAAGYVRYRSTNNYFASTHFKLLDFQQSSPPNTYVQWAPSTTLPTSMMVTKDMAATNVFGTIPSGQLQNDRWYFVEVNMQPTSVTVYLDGAQVISTSKTSNVLNFFNFGVVNCCGTVSGFNLDHWIDGLTLSSSRIYPASTIEISGDGTTWKYQTPMSISETSSQVKLDLSGLTGTSYRIRVKNNRQEVSSVYMLSGGGGDLIAPSVNISTGNPSNISSNSLTISGTSSDAIGVQGCKWRLSAPPTATTGTSCTGTTSFSCSTSGYVTGANTAYVGCYDAAGNYGSANITVNYNVPVNGVCGSNSGGSFTSLTSSDPNNCASGTVYSFLNLTGGWSWGCQGINGGSSTSSAACTATLSTATTLFEEHFENNSFATRGWYDNTNHGTIVSGGQSGNALAWAWAQGATRPTNGGAMRIKFTPTDSLYLTYYVKFQTGWKGSGKAYHPHMFHIPSNLDTDYTPIANNFLNTYVEFWSDTNSPYSIYPQIALQDEQRVNTSFGTPPNNLVGVTENRSVCKCNTLTPYGVLGDCYPDTTYYSSNTWRSSSTVSTNAWHKVEVYFKMNNVTGGIGQSDGLMKEWIDGDLVLDRSDVLYRTGQDSTKKWAQFILGPWIGDGSPIAQTMYIDELSVSTQEPVVPPTPGEAGYIFKGVKLN